MSIFLLENGEMMNDVHGIINYDGDYKMMVDDELDDIDSMWEMYDSNQSLVAKQIKIQEKALNKFKEKYQSELDIAKKDESINYNDFLCGLMKSFCKRNKKVIPSLLYISYCYG